MKMNPAASPEPVKDVQGDNRWMSQVRSNEKMSGVLPLIGYALPIRTGPITDSEYFQP